FLSDHPEDVRAAAVPPTPRQKREGLLGGILFLVVLLGSFAAVVVSWRLAHPEAGFPELALMAVLATMLFIIVDLVVIDWLLICTWLPRGLLIPGTEECVGWRDKGHHVRESVQPKALAVPIVLALVLAGIAWLTGLII